MSRGFLPPWFVLLLVAVATAVIEDSASSTDLGSVKISELHQAPVCPIGKTCQFSATMTTMLTESSDDVKVDSRTEIASSELALVFDVKAECDSPESQLYELTIKEVHGSRSDLAMGNFSCFFAQDKATGTIKHIYLASNDRYDASKIKRGLVHAISKRLHPQVLSHPEALTYKVVDGEDSNGKFVARATVSAYPGGLNLLENVEYADDYANKRVNVDKTRQSSTVLNELGQVVKSQDDVKVVITDVTPEPSSNKPLVGWRRTGITVMAFNVTVHRLATTAAAGPSCVVAASSQLRQLLEARAEAIDALEVAYDHRDTMAELTRSRDQYFEGRDRSASHAEARSAVRDKARRAEALITSAGVTTLDLLDLLLDPESTKPIVDMAWDRRQTDAVSVSAMKKLLAALGGVRTPFAYAHLTQVLSDSAVLPALRRQAAVSLLRGAEESAPPASVLSAVASLAFGDEDDEMRDEAVLLLGALCDGHPSAGVHLAAIEYHLNEDSARVPSLLLALANAGPSARKYASTVQRVAASADALIRPLAELALDRIEGKASARSNGLLGNTTLLEHGHRTVGHDRVGVLASANVTAEYGGLFTSLCASVDVDGDLLDHAMPLVAVTNCGQMHAEAQTAEYSVGLRLLGKFVRVPPSRPVMVESAEDDYCPGTDDKEADTDVIAQHRISGERNERVVHQALLPVWSFPPAMVAISVAATLGYDAAGAAVYNCKTSKAHGDISLFSGVAPTVDVTVRFSVFTAVLAASAGLRSTGSVIRGSLPALASVTTHGAAARLSLNLGHAASHVAMWGETSLGSATRAAPRVVATSSSKAATHALASHTMSHGVVKLVALPRNTPCRWVSLPLVGVHPRGESPDGLDHDVAKGGTGFGVLVWDASHGLLRCHRNGMASTHVPPRPHVSLPTPPTTNPEAITLVSEEEEEEEGGDSDSEAEQDMAHTLVRESTRTHDVVVAGNENTGRLVRNSGQRELDQTRKYAVPRGLNLGVASQARRLADRTAGAAHRSERRVESEQKDLTEGAIEAARRNNRRVNAALREAAKDTRDALATEGSEIKSIEQHDQLAEIKDTVRRASERVDNKGESLEDLMDRQDERLSVEESKDKQRAEADDVSSELRKETEEGKEQERAASVDKAERREFDAVEEQAEMGSMERQAERVKEADDLSARQEAETEALVGREQRANAETRRISRMEKRVDKAATSSGAAARRAARVQDVADDLREEQRQGARRLKKALKRGLRDADARNLESVNEDRIRDSARAAAKTAARRAVAQQMDSTLRQGFQTAADTAREEGKDALHTIREGIEQNDAVQGLDNTRDEIKRQADETKEVARHGQKNVLKITAHNERAVQQRQQRNELDEDVREMSVERMEKAMKMNKAFTVAATRGLDTLGKMKAVEAKVQEAIDSKLRRARKKGDASTERMLKHYRERRREEIETVENRKGIPPEEKKPAGVE